MAITRDAKDVWEEVRQKADKCRESNTPIYTLAENVPNQIIKVESDKIWRQSRDPISKNGGPSPVSRTEIERIWNAIRQNGEAIEERNVTALRFAWALVANFIVGLEFRTKPFRLIVVNEELANRLYVKEEAQAGSPKRLAQFLILMQHSLDFTIYDDQIGEQYHYPNQYFDRVVEGARFIYCRPQEGRTDAEQRQTTVYFGTGIIGAIRRDQTKEGHRYCQIEDYFSFPKEVPYREESGIYLETQTSQIPVMQSAVRVISKQAFEEIVQRSDLQEEAGGFLERLRTAESGMDQIRLLNKAYSSATPKVRQYLTTRVERGTAIGG